MSWWRFEDRRAARTKRRRFARFPQTGRRDGASWCPGVVRVTPISGSRGATLASIHGSYRIDGRFFRDGNGFPSSSFFLSCLPARPLFLGLSYLPQTPACPLDRPPSSSLPQFPNRQSKLPWKRSSQDGRRSLWFRSILLSLRLALSYPPTALLQITPKNKETETSQIGNKCKRNVSLGRRGYGSCG